MSNHRLSNPQGGAWWAAAFAAALLAAGAAQGVSLHADDDVFVNEFNNAVNMNNFTYTVIRSDGIGRDRRPLARFDLSALPSGLTGAEVSQATLRIYVRSVNSGGSVDVHRVTSAWSEGAVTWNTQPTFSGTAEGSVVVGSGAGNEYVTVDVTALVQDWVDGVLSNNGVVLLGDSIANPLATFDSKENEEEGHGMEIEVVLASNAATLCGSAELLDGDGFCVPASSVGVDTNAQTLCASSEYLDGDGNCTLASPLGDITGVSVAGGSGLTGGASSGAAVLDTDAAVLQRRVSGVCAAGSSIREIDAAGAVVCETDVDTNAGTLCTAGEFLDGNGACVAGSLVRDFATNNTATGVNALSSNTTGSDNTASGESALLSNTTGSYNTAIGKDALRENTTGSNNTASGKSALDSNTTGNFNTAIGQHALAGNTSGTHNTASGESALLSNTTGSYNTATGILALLRNTTGEANTASGMNALRENTTGTYNTASGNDALFSNTTGSSNTASGESALRNNTTGSFNSASGKAALRENTTGEFNTANGPLALQENTTGSHNTASGMNALRQNTTGEFNTANGKDALLNSTTGSNNTASGQAALASNTTGNFNTANGQAALFNNTEGSENTASGKDALASNTTGDFNTASGKDALYSNTAGDYNTASGKDALYDNTTGGYNTASGRSALQNNTTGSGNIAIGYFAGNNNLTGSDNIHIASTGANESTTTRIGAAQNRAFIAGIRGVTTGVANAIPVVIDSSGQLGTVSSSARFKEDIHDMEDLSERLLALRPVVYRYRADVQAGERPQQFGLIAEEVEQAFPELVAYGTDGQVETVHYQVLGVLLLNEMQKQDAVAKAQNAQLANQAQMLAAQDLRLATQEQTLAAQRSALARLQQRLAQIEAATTQAAIERSSPLAPVAWNGVSALPSQ